ncbi:efflux RND transporter permease subunit [Salinisphaera sp. SPP-AMP-43]|uniref:efflux RND transporter permease subunit n=1 Tax=Salinisphaera sp. SPP-AMP-43 TaxID=3121288 RepID=UPI003C6E83B8
MSEADRNDDTGHGKLSGPLAWMVHNRVTPNLLMFVLLIGGLFCTSLIKQEVFPQFSVPYIQVSVSYPGATPEQVEQNIVLAIESKAQDIDGIRETTAEASEGAAQVVFKLDDGVNIQTVYQDIQQAVSQITTFPANAERPVISTFTGGNRSVLDMQLYGNVSQTALRAYAEDVRDQLLQSSKITSVSLEGTQTYTVNIEVPQQRLRAYGLTLPEIGNRVAEAAVDVGGGQVDTQSGQILLRLNGRRDKAAEFSRIPILTTADGTVIHLGDIAEVSDGFLDSNTEATYNGMPSIGIAVSRVGDQTPTAVSEAAREAMQKVAETMPPQLHYAINGDQSEVYDQRLKLLLKNAAMGLALVLIVLSLFLDLKLAFWVTLGIPTSFLGAFLFLPMFGMTINMVSMFAFIIALGIVVDDAIVAGENVYEARERGAGMFEAAIIGAREVALPITFSILTNIAAFAPLLFIPGFLGNIFETIPVVVITVFVISWVEAMLIMPSHLAHGKNRRSNRLSMAIYNRQQAFSRGFSTLVSRYYQPFAAQMIHHRYLTAATGVAVLILVLAWAASGRMGFSLMPKVESDHAEASLTMPYGTPMPVMEQTRTKLRQAADDVAAQHGNDQLLKGVFATIEQNTLEMRAYLTSPGVRPISTAQFSNEWRTALGDVPGLQSAQFQSDAGGPGSGKDLTVELSARDTDMLDKAAQTLADRLADFQGVHDIDSGVAHGKQQLSFTLNDNGRSLGLTNESVGAQVRAAFYGNEALRQLRGSNEVRVMVQLPKVERDSRAAVRNLLIRTPNNTYVPLSQIASIQPTHAFTTIKRHNGQRTIDVTANVTPRSATNRIMNTLNSSVLPQLKQDYPGLATGYNGIQEDVAESMHAIFVGFVISMVLIYILLAIPFRSYIQPAIVMLAIPFGVVGAIIGHTIMGYSLSVISLFGVLALAGVVVNDSLVLIYYANTLRDEGRGAAEAVRLAAVRRFRPIILTTLTTFGGLAPMIFETSLQARFMIPMAISLGFGILFATGITLGLVPCFYVIVEDIKTGLMRRLERLSGHHAHALDHEG